MTIVYCSECGKAIVIDGEEVISKMNFQRSGIQELISYLETVITYVNNYLSTVGKNVCVRNVQIYYEKDEIYDNQDDINIYIKSNDNVLAVLKYFYKQDGYFLENITNYKETSRYLEVISRINEVEQIVL